MSTWGTVNYCIRLVGPSTGKFIGELDPDRLVLKTKHRQVTEYIDLAALIAEYHGTAQAGTVTAGA